MASSVNKIRILGLLALIVALGFSCKHAEKEKEREKLINTQELSGQWILHKAKGDLLQVPLFNPESTACIMQFEEDQVHIWDLRDESFKEYYPKGSWELAGDTLNIDLNGEEDIRILLRKLSDSELMGTMIVFSAEQERVGRVLFRKMNEPVTTS